MSEDTRNALQKAIDGVGPYKIAKLVNLRGPSIYKWRESGRLPRTEWTGETNYAAVIAEATKGTSFECTREQLLQLPSPSPSGKSDVIVGGSPCQEPSGALAGVGA